MFKRFTAGFAFGYVLGARAGEKRYDQLTSLAERALDNPTVSRIVDTSRERVMETGRHVLAGARDRLTGGSSSEEFDETEEYDEGDGTSDGYDDIDDIDDDVDQDGDDVDDEVEPEQPDDEEAGEAGEVEGRGDEQGQEAEDQDEDSKARRDEEAEAGEARRDEEPERREARHGPRPRPARAGGRERNGRHAPTGSRSLTSSAARLVAAARERGRVD